MIYVNVASPSLEAVALLARHPLLQGLDRQIVVDACAGAMRQRLGAGEPAFLEGDPASHCLLVVSGGIEVVRFGEDGSERIFGRFQSGQLVAEAALFMPHGRYPMNGRAFAPTLAWRLPRASMRGAGERHPALAMRLLESFSDRLYRRINEIEWVTCSNAQQRLAAYLMELVDRQGASIELPISQRQLAARLGVRAETLSRLLADWQARGWVRGERRQWQVRQPASLGQMAVASVRPF